MTMQPAMQAQPVSAPKMEAALMHGDLAKLSPEQKLSYYQQVCESLGLNPLTKPFEFLTLNGKMILYARRECTEQLRKINCVSIQIVSRDTVEGVYIVTARATDRTGRCDESTGAVPIAGIKGEALANAIMKGETKAKRRVTLSICGLGMLDESEVASIPGAVVTQVQLEVPLLPLDPKPSTADATMKLVAEAGGNLTAILGHYKASRIEDLNEEQLNAIRQRALAKIEEKAKAVPVEAAAQNF